MGFLANFSYSMTEQYIPKHKEQNSESANHLLWCGSSDEQENEQYCQDRPKAHNDYLMNLRAEEESKAVLGNFAAQNRALEEIYRELLALKSKMENVE